jgi:membrane-associated protease RseP (regulator of RpoE activity)
VRESALDHADDISWNEWSVEQIGDITDESRWYEVNPALGTRLDIDILRAQLGTMDELGFAQEVLGYWLPVVLAMAVIPAKDWQATTIRREDAPRSGKIALGVKFTPDGKSAAVSAAIIPPGKDAKPYVELLAFREITGGTRWLVGGIMANAKAASVVLIDGKGGSGSLEQALYEAGMPRNAVSVAALTDVQTAESAFLRDVSEHEVTHIKQRWLDDSAAKSVRRNIGNNGAFGFGDGEGSSSAPIESASLALHGARTSRRNPQRKQEARY